MKILFVTHTTGYGGAAISFATNFRYLLENSIIGPGECVIAIPRDNKRTLSASAYGWFEGRVKFRYWYMPFSTAYKGGSEQIHAKIYSVIKEGIAALFFLGVYNHIIRREKITHIHLNSMVFWSLLPVLPKEVTKIIHVREIITDDLSGKVARRIINKYADRIIAISRQTAKGLPRAELAENPYDMYRARQYRNVRTEIKSQLGLPEDSFIVSVFSPLGAQKGTDFLVQVIRKIPKELPLHFVLVGEPFRGEQRLLRKLKNTDCISIFPTSSHMDRFYAITDIVLRCEGYLPLGRTVYEGVYAGCLALLPIGSDDYIGENEMVPQIHLYAAGNAEHCVNQILSLYRQYSGGVYNNGFAPTTNVQESATRLWEVLK